MTKAQASQVLDWLTSNGWSANLAASPAADGSVTYSLSAIGSGDATKMRSLIGQIEQRDLQMIITGFTITDRIQPPAPVA